MILAPIESPTLVPFDESFSLDAARTTPPPDALRGKEATAALGPMRDELFELQRRLWAERSRAVLMIFQARDTAGKDSAIRNVLRGLNPAGIRVRSFSAPTVEEREHDFLWRHAVELPQRGKIGVHNRSWYEEVLVVRVHPRFLGGQHIALPPDPMALWNQRYESIRDFERHLARNGTIVLKFFLNISRDEQRQRLLRRLDRESKNYLFEPGDLDERALWPQYQHAYEDAINGTSRPYAPWYAIPADDKPHARWVVADVLLRALQRLDPKWPTPSRAMQPVFDEARQRLLDE
jgi:PPK2 family polyphosphate:nucleotide phosphotransferase